MTTDDMNEADTRAVIDKQLEAVGWGILEGSRIKREYVITLGTKNIDGTRAKNLKADYALIYKGKILAVVEAKSLDQNASEGVAQAKLYAEKLQLQTSYATNSKEIYQICHKSGKEGHVERFLSPFELWEKTFAETNTWMDKFNEIPYEDMGRTKELRFYQEIAVDKIMNAIAHDKKRILLTLATGTGKTFIAFQVAWKLFHARWNVRQNPQRTPRILFLADRNILADQASLAFSSFTADAITRITTGQIKKKGEVPTNASLFFTIFQTFMSGEKKDPYFGQYEPDFFDLVIIDECHRGGANDESSWRKILDYFKGAVHLGLTATPKKDDNVDTYDYFGEPVYTYSLKEGIEDGFLTPFKVKRIQTSMDDYSYVSDDEVIEGEVDTKRIYEKEDFNYSIEIKARERKRVQLMLLHINKDEKTIVFCANQRHAALIRDLINQKSVSSSVDYCVRVTSIEGKIGDNHLKTFQDNDKFIPTILTTSEKLTTGVDARNIRNIVLMHPINNIIKFKQIIGRGTRLFEGKNYFTILDFSDAYRMFYDDAWDGEAIAIEKISDNEKNGEERSPPIEEDFPVGKEERFRDKKEMVKIKLADGKERAIQSMTTTFFYQDGKPITPEEFLREMYKTLTLPPLFQNEEALRQIWGNTKTRKELLAKLKQAGCSKNDLKKLQQLFDVEASDLFDVLRYIAYAKKPVSRSHRVDARKNIFYKSMNDQQKEFIEFVLNNYIKDGVNELDDSKLSKVLKIKYGSVHEAKEKLGNLKQIKKIFANLQQQLYDPATA